MNAETLWNVKQVQICLFYFKNKKFTFTSLFTSKSYYLVSCILKHYWHNKHFHTIQTNIDLYWKKTYNTPKVTILHTKSQVIWNELLQGHTMLPFTLSKIWWTFVAGTHPSLTMVMVPMKTRTQDRLRKVCGRKRKTQICFLSSTFINS